MARINLYLELTIVDIILGHDSMIGSHLSKLLPDAKKISHKQYDLMSMIDCREIFECGPRYVYNLTGMNGGLLYNRTRPADIFYQSTQMNLNILTCCHEYMADKVINVISACSYPDRGEEVLKEENLFEGMPSPSTECHGFAKRILLEYSRQLNKQYNLDSICIVLTNCYGDGDRFDLSRTKVVGAAIRKICDAKRENLPSVTFFGDGSPIRELMYAGDAAKSIKLMMENYSDPLNPVNVGSGQTISILNLVNTIKELVGYNGEIIWDTSKPNGQLFRKLSLDKMEKYLSFEMTPFKVGLERAISYYEYEGRFLNR